MSHETVESYYRNTFSTLFHKDIGVQNSFQLSDWEGMLPYERDIYMSLISSKVEELQKAATKS